MKALVIAILEWNSDSGLEPEMFIADNAIDARRAALGFIAERLPTPADVEIADDDEDDHDGSINYIDREWVQENPLPADLDDDEAVTAWLATFKDATTDLWLRIYTGAGTEQSPDFDSAYNDIRK